MNIDKFIKSAEKSINMERNAKNGYMECFLGIIDILGFSDFVNNNENAVKLITEIISNSFFSNESQLEKISYKMLSDTLIVYTNENIDMLLFRRHIGKKLRRSGKKAGGEKKRNGENDIKFAFEFENLIKSANIC